MEADSSYGVVYGVTTKYIEQGNLVNGIFVVIDGTWALL